ncbi:hypothetical protein F4806DRAFT_507633 [Annulohypoxylon nitens]|nr:hypothetical protein F4806DRAFT_507633 [Annulohypoxylon nitens]
MDYLTYKRHRDVGKFRNGGFFSKAQKAWERRVKPTEFRDRASIAEKEDNVPTVTGSSENANDNSTKLKEPTKFSLKIVLDFIRLYDKITDGVRSVPLGDYRLDQAEAEVDGTGAGAGADGGGGSSSTNANSSISTQNPTSSSSASKRQGVWRRQRGKDREDRPNRGGGNPPFAVRRAIHSGPKLACPFYLADNIRHWNCHGFGFTRIGDMRQHIKRKHVPPLHCPTCGEEFRDLSSRDDHIDARACQESYFPRTWATLDMLDELDNTANRLNSHSDEERWYIIWDIMFPGRARPPSPYIDNTHEGTRVSLIRAAIIEYQTQAEYQQLPPQQRQAVDLILNHFLTSVSGDRNRQPLGSIISQLTSHSTLFPSNPPELCSSFLQSVFPQPQLQAPQIGAAILPHSQGQNPTSPFSQFTFDGDIDADFVDLDLLTPVWPHNSMS